jgi:hypothetical protein
VQLAIPLCKASARFEEYKVCACTQEKNARNQKEFWARQLYFWTAASPFSPLAKQR